MRLLFYPRNGGCYNSRTCDDHVEHLRIVFETLRYARLYGKLEKCHFCQESVVFLGYIIYSNWIKVDKEKIKAIKD